MAPWLAGEGLLSTTNQTVTDRAAGRAVGQPRVCMCVCVYHRVPWCWQWWARWPGDETLPCSSLLAVGVPSLPSCLLTSLSHSRCLSRSVCWDLPGLLSFFQFLWPFVSFCLSVTLSHSPLYLPFSRLLIATFHLVDATVIKTECVFLSSWALTSGNDKHFNPV